MNTNNQSWYFPVLRTFRFSAALGLIALFSSVAAAQTAEEIAAQKLMVEKLQKQITAATVTPTSTTAPTAPTTTSTSSTTTTTTTTTKVELDDPTAPESFTHSPSMDYVAPSRMNAPIAVAGDRSAKVSFAPPAIIGSGISKYTVTSSPGGIVVSGPASPITVTGLTSIPYTFSVTATNSLGTSSASPPSAAVTPTAAAAATTPVVAPTWTLLSGAARDVGLGGVTPSLWVVGTNAASNGYAIWRWVNNAWTAVASTGATRIDVDAGGLAWIVDSSGAVLKYGTGWSQVGSAAGDIGVGANGTAWITGNTAEAAIFRFDAGKWTRMPGAAVRVDVDPNGNAWVVNAAGAVYRWTGSSWVHVAGVAARDVGIGADGSVFVTGTDNTIYRWNGSTGWAQRAGAGVAISTDSAGVPVVINSSGSIYKGWK